MAVDDRLSDLLVEWEQGRRSGQEPSVEELCRDTPDLLPVVRESIASLRATEWMFDPQPAEPSSSPSRRRRAALHDTELPASHLTAQEFAASIFQSGLLSRDEIEELQLRLNDTALPGEAREIASKLVSEGKLTRYQAAVLLKASKGSAADRQLRDPRHARHGRDGARLQGTPPVDEPRRRAQAAAGRHDERPRHGEAVPARGAGGRRAQASQHRCRLRRRRIGGDRLPCPRICRRHQPLSPGEGTRPAAAGRGGRFRAAGGDRPELSALTGHHPPRREAGQPPPRQRRHRSNSWIWGWFVSPRPRICRARKWTRS